MGQYTGLFNCLSPVQYHAIISNKAQFDPYSVPYEYLEQHTTRFISIEYFWIACLFPMLFRPQSGLLTPYGDIGLGQLCSGNGLTAPSHYRIQYWLPINEVHWHSPVGNFTKKTSLFLSNLPRVNVLIDMNIITLKLDHHISNLPPIISLHIFS